MEKTMIQARRRWDLGKNGSHRLRNEGWIPAVMYGKGSDPVPLAVERAFLDRLMHTPSGRNQIYALKLDDQNSTDVLIRDFELNPVREELIHVDFLVVDETRVVRVNIPIETDGVPIGVKNFGGMLVPLLKELPVECLPQDIPGIIRIDVSNLDLNQGFRVKDLPISGKVKVLVDPEVNVVHVEVTRVAAAATPEEEAAAATEEAAAAEEPAES
jgi:large subunit ribosomal protein L25